MNKAHTPEQCSLYRTLGHAAGVVAHHLLDTLAHVELGLPLQDLLGTRSVGTTTLRVVGRHVLVDNVDALGERVALLLLHLLDNVLLISVGSGENGGVI